MDVGEGVAGANGSVMESDAWCFSATGPVFGNGRSVSVSGQPGCAGGIVDDGGIKCGGPTLGAQ